jgi:putative ABC transport system permease protein
MRSAIGRDAVIVSEAFSIRHGVAAGDRLVLDTRHGRHPFSVAAVYYDYSSDRGVVTMDGATFARHFGSVAPTGLTVYLRAGADAERTRAAILAALGPDRHVFIYTNRSLRAEVLRIFDSTFAITYALELIAIVVAMLGVTGTLLTLTLERQRELTMLRLAGAERGQVQRMVVIEAALVGGVSQAIGLVVGTCLSLVLVYVINLQSFGWSLQFHLPVAFLGQLSAALVVTTAAAGLYPARRASALAMEGRLDDE